jgi:hypothetical protein
MACWLELILPQIESLDLLLLVTNSLILPAWEDTTRMAHKGYIAHHIPGHRIRIRVPHKKRDSAFFQGVATQLNGIDGVKVSVTPETGSVLVHYKGDLEHLLLSAAEAGLSELIELEMGGEPLEPLADRLLSQAGAIEQKLLASTGGQVDVRTFAMLGLVLAAGVQLFRGQIFGPAVPLLWYTAEIIRNYIPNRLPRQN